MDIPSSVAGLLSFVILLCPGFAYTAMRARRLPERQYSTLRETVAVVTTSLVAIVIVGTVFACLRAIFPTATPDVHLLIFDTRAYLADNYVAVAWWALALLGAAVFGSLALAVARSSDRLQGVMWLKWFVFPPDRSSMSSWWLAFTAWNPDQVDIHVGCTLDDGSYVRGRLYSYSQLAADVEDRDLTLVSPIGVRAKGHDDVEQMANVGLMAISARHMVTMAVTYIPKAQTDAGEITTSAATRATPDAPDQRDAAKDATRS